MVDLTKKIVPLEKQPESISHFWKDYYIAKHGSTLEVLDSNGQIHSTCAIPEEIGEMLIFISEKYALFTCENVVWIFEENKNMLCVTPLNLPEETVVNTVKMLKNSFLLSIRTSTNISYLLQIR